MGSKQQWRAHAGVTKRNCSGMKGTGGEQKGKKKKEPREILEEEGKGDAKRGSDLHRGTES